MRSFALIPLLVGVAIALPQDAPSCVTTTTQVIVPTSTATYTTTDVTTVTATTPDDLGTFTDVTTISSTTTVQTITTTSTDCTASGTIIAGPTTTVYTTSGAAPATTSAPAYKRALGLAPRQDSDCTITEPSTTTYGQTYTFVAAPGETSTYTQYTEFTQATVTETSTGGRAYTVATATTTLCTVCGPTSSATSPTATSTATLDARCAPTSLVSAAGGTDNKQFGIQYIGTITGAVYTQNTTDASACCQLCVDAGNCAVSAWNVQNGLCRLEFTADYSTGEVKCGNQLVIAYYDAGPSSPMAPGSGLFVGDLCGTVGYFNAKPDDGT